MTIDAEIKGQYQGAVQDNLIPAIVVLKKRATWAADMLLTCKVGRLYEASDENLILQIIEGRSGPIGAAIAINIELPAD